MFVSSTSNEYGGNNVKNSSIIEKEEDIDKILEELDVENSESIFTNSAEEISADDNCIQKSSDETPFIRWERNYI